MAAVRTIENMTLDGGIACLDFANSGFDTDEAPVERLHQYADLLTLSQRLQLFPSDYLQRLKAFADAHPRKATDALKVSLQVRDIIFEMFEAIARKKVHTVQQESLDIFNQYLSTAQSKRVVQLKEGAFVEDWDLSKEDLLHPLWAFLLSSHELLTAHHHELIKQCGGCRWLFVDSSKSHRRKWCNMQDCGSLVKAKRYYHKAKGKREDLQ